MIVQRLKKIQVRFTLVKQLQGPVSSTSRNESQLFGVGDSYALRSSKISIALLMQ